MSEQRTDTQDTDFYSDTGEFSLGPIFDQDIEVTDPVTNERRKISKEIAGYIARNFLTVPGSIDTSNPAHKAVKNALQDQGTEIPDSATNPSAVPPSYYPSAEA